MTDREALNSSDLKSHTLHVGCCVQSSNLTGTTPQAHKNLDQNVKLGSADEIFSETNVSLLISFNFRILRKRPRCPFFLARELTSQLSSVTKCYIIYLVTDCCQVRFYWSDWFCIMQ